MLFSIAKTNVMMLKVHSPYDFKIIKEVPYSTGNEIESSLSKAYDLFSDNKNWLPPWKRIEILEKVVSIMDEDMEHLTRIAAEEGGKPYKDSLVEVNRAINGIKIAISEIGHLSGKEIPMGQTIPSEGRIAFTIREPIGVVLSISAFNHPLNLIIHQVVTAIAAGCPVLIKPALTTPISCLNFVEILKQAGLPDGWCNCIICDNVEAEKLAADHRINYLSFIGSAKVGWYLRSKLSPGTRCALEHGGVAPVIVEPDANINELIPAITKGGFYHAGQVCVSVQKVMVHESILDEVATQLCKRASELIVGDPLNENTDVGPLILKHEVNRVEMWVEDAKNNGGTILTGGKRISDSCFEPTVILNPGKDALVSKEEIFGPVICIYQYSNLDEAISVANSLTVAFQASVFTNNINTALNTARKVNASAVMINDHTAFRVDWMPFGGRDNSGIGVGGIPYTMREMTREKLIVIKTS